MILELFCNARAAHAASATTLAESLAAVLSFTFSAFLANLCAALAANVFLKGKLRGANGSTAAGVVTLLSRAAGVAFFAAAIHTGNWCAVAAAALGLPGNAVAMNLCGMAAYVLICVAGWLPLYRLHAAVSPGKWSLWGYLLHKFRYTFFVLGLWPLLLLLSELLENSRPHAYDWRDATFLACMATLVWAFPLFLRLFWGCKPLTDARLLARIEALCTKAGARFSAVCVWDLGGGALPNAAAVGFFPPFRYLFISRGLLDCLEDEELEGVIAHEIGHVRYRHLLLYFVMLSAYLQVVYSACGELLPYAGPLAQAGVAFAALALFVRFIFAFFSRHLERQADLSALALCGNARGLCRALEKLGQVYGNIRNAPSWHHLGIAARVSFLRSAQLRPELALMHHAQVGRLKLLTYFASGLILYSALTEQLALPPPPEADAAAPERHWRTVCALLPEEAAPPLRLAELYAKDPSRTADALRLAERAAALAATPEESQAAEKLCKQLRARQSLE